MKLYKFFIAALAVGMMASCSDSDEDSNGSGTPQEPTDGYVALSINLPTDAGTPTRAGDKDNSEQVEFDDGLPSEYTVTDAYLILFEGTDEATATLSSAYNITPNWEKETFKQITTSAKIVQKVKGPGASNNFYAFVVLNCPSELEFTINGVGTYYTLKVSGDDFMGKTFKDLQKAIVAHGITSGKLTMCNSPLTTQAGGNVKTTDPQITSVPYATLATIDHDAVYSTEAEAKAKPAAVVFVERVAAKVTVEATATDKSFTPGSTEKYEYTVDKWALDNTNTGAYLSRVIPEVNTYCYELTSGYNNYRFMGTTKVGGYDNYRLYWAEDINYHETTGNLALTTGALTPAAAIDGDPGTDNPQYCFENTFSTKYQDYRNTTRVIVKTTLKPSTLSTEADGTFYVLNGGTDVLYKETDIQSLLQAQAMKSMPIQNWAAENVSGTLAGTNFNFTYTVNSKNRVVVSAVTASGYTVKTGGVDLTTAQLSDLVAYVNATAVIDKYAEGTAYYVVRIKHFGDVLCPWSDAQHIGEPQTTDYMYEPDGGHDGTYNDARYLGRYGVVRNNWYDINITGLKNIGKPYVPNITEDGDGDTPDDDVDAYIAVKINILSWAKRTQQEVLK